MTTNTPTPEESLIKILSFGTPEQQRRFTGDVTPGGKFRNLNEIVYSTIDLSKADLSRAVRTDPHACVDYCSRYLRYDINGKPCRLRRFEDVIATNAGAIARYATTFLLKRWTSKEHILKENLNSIYVMQYVHQFTKNHFDSCNCWMCTGLKKK